MFPALDYDDIVKTGEASARPSRKEGCRKYAVIIKSAKASIGKFDITDKASVEESIYALANNQGIPPVIRKSAEYFVKAAADYFGCPCELNPDPAPHVILISDIIAKTAEHEDVVMLSFGKKNFVLSDTESIKEAEGYFLSRTNLIPPTERINVSRIIVKAAATTPYTPNEVTRAYCRAEYGNSVNDILSTKAKLCNDAKYASVMESLSKCYHNIPVHEFLDMVESCDKAASAHHSKFGIQTHDLLMDNPKSVANALSKQARLIDPVLRVIRDK